MKHLKRAADIDSIASEAASNCPKFPGPDVKLGLTCPDVEPNVPVRPASPDKLEGPADIDCELWPD